MKVKRKQYGSKPFSKADEDRGFKVFATANDLSKMDSDRFENVKAFTLAQRRESHSGSTAQRKTLRRSESTKGASR